MLECARDVEGGRREIVRTGECEDCDTAEEGERQQDATTSAERRLEILTWLGLCGHVHSELEAQDARRKQSDWLRSFML